jgi:peptidoglycan/xylan/chitin deacetylase (PgdA/CDA1 family)
MLPVCTVHEYTPGVVGALFAQIEYAAAAHCYTARVSAHAMIASSSGLNAARIAASAGAAALAVGGFYYAALWPASRLFGRSLIAGNDAAEVALTYDDGPNDPYTGQLMDVLARHHVRATFFVIGRYVRQKPQIVRTLHHAGHLIGCHTMTHPKLMYMSRKRIRAEIADATALIEDTIGDRVRFFRPPFGARNPGVFHVATQLRLTPVLWNVTSWDWSAKSAAEIELRLQSGIAHNQRRKRGSNVLMHDGGHVEMGSDRRRTVTATANLLAAASSNGIRFVTLDRWRPAAPGDTPL